MQRTSFGHQFVIDKDDLVTDPDETPLESTVPPQIILRFPVQVLPPKPGT